TPGSGSSIDEETAQWSAREPEQPPPPLPRPARLRDDLFSGLAEENGRVSPSPHLESRRQDLARIAQRLEAVLRRPRSELAAQAPTAVPDDDEADDLVPPAATARNNTRSGRGDVKPKRQRSIYDSVEQEMTNVRRPKR